MKVKFSRKLFLAFNAFVLAALAVVCLLPIIHVVMSSFSDPQKLANSMGLVIWPKGYSLKGYIKTLHSSDIWNGYKNTLIYVVLQTSLGVFFTSLGAYALSRSRLMLKNPIMFLISFTMMFNGGMIPNYLLMNDLGLMNTVWAVIIPGCITPMNLIIMRTFFASIPESLEESAKLDGAGAFRILFSIYYPLAKASIAVITLFLAVAQWNSYFVAMLYLQERSQWPLQLILKDFITTAQGAAALTGPGQESAAESVMLTRVMNNCVIVVGSLPIFLFYPFIQKYFVKGVMIGSIKG